MGDVGWCGESLWFRSSEVVRMIFLRVGEVCREELGEAVELGVSWWLSGDFSDSAGEMPSSGRVGLDFCFCGAFS